MHTGICPNCGSAYVIQANAPLVQKDQFPSFSIQSNDENQFYQNQVSKMEPPQLFETQSKFNEQQKLNEQVDGNKNKETKSNGFFGFPFLDTIKEITLSSTKFFSKNKLELLTNDKISSALAFAITVTWISNLMQFIYKSLITDSLNNKMNKIISDSSIDIFSSETEGALRSIERFHHNVNDFLFGAGNVVLFPFLMCIKIFFISAIVHLGVLFIFKKMQDRPQTYSTTIKIICYGLAPSVLSIVPVLGTLASSLLVFVVTVVGLSEVYGSSRSRAFFAMLFPYILFGFIIIASLLFAVTLGALLMYLVIQ